MYIARSILMMFVFKDLGIPEWKAWVPFYWWYVFVDEVYQHGSIKPTGIFLFLKGKEIPLWVFKFWPLLVAGAAIIAIIPIIGAVIYPLLVIFMTINVSGVLYPDFKYYYYGENANPIQGIFMGQGITMGIEILYLEKVEGILPEFKDE